MQEVSWGVTLVSVTGLLLGLNAAILTPQSSLTTGAVGYPFFTGLPKNMYFYLYCQKWPLSCRALWTGAFISFRSKMSLVSIRCSWGRRAISKFKRESEVRTPKLKVWFWHPVSFSHHHPFSCLSDSAVNQKRQNRVVRLHSIPAPSLIKHKPKTSDNKIRHKMGFLRKKMRFRCLRINAHLSGAVTCLDMVWYSRKKKKRSNRVWDCVKRRLNLPSAVEWAC